MTEISVIVFKREGDARQYAINHKGEHLDHPVILWDGKLVHYIMDDNGVHSIPKYFGEMVAKHLKLANYPVSRTISNVTVVTLKPEEERVTFTYMD